MPKYHVERSITIDAPVSAVSRLTDDFNEWTRWSPWLCMEPEATVSVSGSVGQPGHAYSWTGELVGAGEIQTESLNDGVHKLHLTFLKPFKSTAKVELHLQATGTDQTQVTWHMWSAMPFFLFFMTGTIKAMIGMDYDRGLKMLKDCAETGSIPSRIESTEVVQAQQIHYVGVEAESSMDTLAASFGKSMPRIDSLANDRYLERTEKPAGAIYNKTDLKQAYCHYTAIIPISEPTTASPEMLAGTIEASKAVKVVHRGSYRHLGNAWATAMTYQRYNKLKPLKKQPPYEIYLTTRPPPMKAIYSPKFIFRCGLN